MKQSGARAKRPADSEVARANTIVERLRAGELSSEEVFEAFGELDELAPTIVRDAMSPWTGPAPAPHALQLRRIAIVKDADVLDLGPHAEEQLRLGGKSWDGADLDAVERLDGEIEGSFAGSVEHLVLADADDPSERPLFDVLRYAGDSGIIFRAGTTDVVGRIASGTVEMQNVRDHQTRLAIAAALATDVVEEAPRPKRTAKKTATAKKSAAPKKKASTSKKTAAAKKATTSTARKTTKKATTKARTSAR